MSDSLRPQGLYSPWNSPGQNTGVGSRFLLHWIFPTRGSNPGLPHCWRVIYQLSHQGSPRILEWVAIPFSRGSSQPGDQTQVLYSRQILYRLSNLLPCKQAHQYHLSRLSVQFSRSVVSDSLQSHEPQHARPPCPSPTPVVHPNSCASSR